MKSTIRGALGALMLLWPGLTAGQDGNRLLERAATSRMKGQPGAPVMIYEIADFQCPFCARFARETLPRLDSAFIKTGKVQWFFVNLPLPTHGAAWLAAEAALCAGAVNDRFWPVHDRLFAAQSEWSQAKDVPDALARIARDAGAGGEAYDACLAHDRLAALILQDVIFAANLRITGTPAFIINNATSFVGLKTFEEWRDLIEKALKEGNKNR
ncbi:MAG: DsbA family protein [Longimicrobiales bacterium]